MKYTFASLVIVLVSFNAFVIGAEACADLSGNWVGTCKSTGPTKEYTQELKIKLVDPKTTCGINLNGIIYGWDEKNPWTLARKAESWNDSMNYFHNVTHGGWRWGFKQFGTYTRWSNSYSGCSDSINDRSVNRTYGLKDGMLETQMVTVGSWTRMRDGKVESTYTWHDTCLFKKAAYEVADTAPTTPEPMCPTYKSEH